MANTERLHISGFRRSGAVTPTRKYIRRGHRTPLKRSRAGENSSSRAMSNNCGNSRSVADSSCASKFAGSSITMSSRASSLSAEDRHFDNADATPGRALSKGSDCSKARTKLCLCAAGSSRSDSSALTVQWNILFMKSSATVAPPFSTRTGGVRCTTWLRHAISLKPSDIRHTGHHCLSSHDRPINARPVLANCSSPRRTSTKKHKSGAIAWEYVSSWSWARTRTAFHGGNTLVGTFRSTCRPFGVRNFSDTVASPPRPHTENNRRCSGGSSSKSTSATIRCPSGRSTQR